MADSEPWLNDPIVRVEKHLYPLAPRLLRGAAGGMTPGPEERAALGAAAEFLRMIQSRILDQLDIRLSQASEKRVLSFAETLRILAGPPGDAADPRLSDVAYLSGPFVDEVEQTIDALRADFLSQIMARQARADAASAIAAREVAAISRQIYFISINASVEAARVGDAGRGFAVIGEQIRNLSQDAATALRRMSNPSATAR